MGELSKLKTLPSSSFRLRNRSLEDVRLRRIFDLFDSNKNGELTVLEISQALNRLGLEANESEISSVVSDYFKPDRICMDFDDFLKFHQSIGDDLFGEPLDEVEEDSECIDEDLRQAFMVFDENNDGFISALELQKVLDKLGMTEEGAEEGRVESMICSVDRNQDGKVDLIEFKQMMRSISTVKYA
ncbi:Calcium-binding protein CML42 [Zostera marina]|uniref:Calcium-binding protein CML42 n=1 Tax=Zostera marina TaxID=29655 RepID=A0A0K9NPL6_ZOSMR|nr:Calcium-binding protein CML42 [Zostera marina]